MRFTELDGPDVNDLLRIEEESKLEESKLEQ